jgi:hypothetical protein
MCESESGCGANHHPLGKNIVRNRIICTGGHQDATAKQKPSEEPDDYQTFVHLPCGQAQNLLRARLPDRQDWQSLMIVRQQPDSIEPASLDWVTFLMSVLAWALMLIAVWDV